MASPRVEGKEVSQACDGDRTEAHTTDPHLWSYDVVVDAPSADRGGGGLSPAADSEVFRQELLRGRVELQTVLRFREAVAFVAEHHQLVRDPLRLHRVHDLFGLRELHPRVV